MGDPNRRALRPGSAISNMQEAEPVVIFPNFSAAELYGGCSFAAECDCVFLVNCHGGYVYIQTHYYK